MTAAAARGIALFLGAFSLVNVAGDALAPGFDATLWWLDLRALPALAARALLALGALALLAFGLRPVASPWRRRATVALVAAHLAAALANAAGYYALVLRSGVHRGFPVPLSLLVAAALALVAREAWRAAPSPPGRVALALAACAVAFPLAQMVCYGKTDYRRRADAAVVFGARAYADGRPSPVLSDRVRTGCDLYRAGLVRALVFSGGPGDGAVDEPEAMRRLARRLGVPDGAILRDPAGRNTEATVANTLPLFRRHGFARVLAVSHFYHLPRVKMAYARRGLDVYTVPAREHHVVGRMPLFMAREVAALWAYYARPPRRGG